MIRLLEKINFNNYTLIIPSVSVGNVGQLTNDLLICALNLRCVGTVYHKALIPAVGPNPYDPKLDICLACELYASEKYRIAVLQLRSSVEQKYADEFFEDLKRYIMGEQFKEVLILTSSYAHEMHNITSSKYRYITNKEISDFDNLDILPMEPSQNGNYVIYGSGYAHKLFTKLKDSVKTSIIIKYASEGDNRADAYSMFHILQKIMDLNVEQNVKQPYSWNLVFGGPPPIGIY